MASIFKRLLRVPEFICFLYSREREREIEFNVCRYVGLDIDLGLPLTQTQLVAQMLSMSEGEKEEW